eukprot:gnl/Chilomastix_cuspidata/1951.p2 GENE.gnl/Chilomastix_cuspidata/1951~~gnl/Chilomastix_cuspidata/1951.p2  ORF type:complete len:153 (+),score=18.91 gnl/Chilomastix_cuspidata/1951:309-767(+)
MEPPRSLFINPENAEEIDKSYLDVLHNSKENKTFCSQRNSSFPISEHFQELSGDPQFSTSSRTRFLHSPVFPIFSEDQFAHISPSNPQLPLFLSESGPSRRSTPRTEALGGSQKPFLEAPPSSSQSLPTPERASPARASGASTPEQAAAGAC